MRTAALVLGCVGGGLLLLIETLIAITHPDGLFFVLAGGFGIAGGITARTQRVLGGIFLCIATALTLFPALFITGIGIVVLFVPFVLLLLATIFAFVASRPVAPLRYYPPQ